MPVFGDAAGVATDSLGNLYVSHFSEASIDVFKQPITAASTPAFTIQLASACGPTAALPNSSGINFDAAGNLWIAGELGGQMYMLSPPFAGGCVVPNFFNASPALTGPVIGVFDRAGDLIIAEFAGSTMLVFRPPFAFGPANVAAATMPLPSQLGGAGISIKDQLVVGLNDGRVAFFNPPFATGNTPAFYIPAPVGSSGVRNMIFSGGNLYVPYAFTSQVGVFGPPFSSSSSPLFEFSTGLSFPYGLAVGQ